MYRSEAALSNPIAQAFKDSLSILSGFCTDGKNVEKTAHLAEQLAGCFETGNKILVCGNGGSAADAMHFAEEFTGRFRMERRALPVLALTDPAHITCVANDFGFDKVFSRQIEAFGKMGDWLMVISTSGNSSNLIEAVEEAKKNRMKTVALLGGNGGNLKNICDVEFVVEAKTADRIQEVHMIILHIVVEGIERILFPQNYGPFKSEL